MFCSHLLFNVVFWNKTILLSVIVANAAFFKFSFLNKKNIKKKKHNEFILNFNNSQVPTSFWKLQTNIWVDNDAIHLIYPPQNIFIFWCYHLSMTIIKNGPYHYYSLQREKKTMSIRTKKVTRYAQMPLKHMFFSFLHTQHEQRALQYITEKEEKTGYAEKGHSPAKNSTFFLVKRCTFNKSRNREIICFCLTILHKWIKISFALVLGLSPPPGLSVTSYAPLAIRSSRTQRWQCL